MVRATIVTLQLFNFFYCHCICWNVMENSFLILHFISYDITCSNPRYFFSGQCFSLWFLPRDAMQARPMSSCGVSPSVCLSVCVSITHTDRQCHQVASKPFSYRPSSAGPGMLSECNTPGFQSKFSSANLNQGSAWHVDRYNATRTVWRPTFEGAH